MVFVKPDTCVLMTVYQVKILTSIPCMIYATISPVSLNLLCKILNSNQGSDVDATTELM